MPGLIVHRWSDLTRTNRMWCHSVQGLTQLAANFTGVYVHLSAVHIDPQQKFLAEDDTDSVGNVR